MGVMSPLANFDAVFNANNKISLATRFALRRRWASSSSDADPSRLSSLTPYTRVTTAAPSRTKCAVRTCEERSEELMKRVCRVERAHRQRFCTYNIAAADFTTIPNAINTSSSATRFARRRGEQDPAWDVDGEAHRLWKVFNVQVRNSDDHNQRYMILTNSSLRS